MDDSGNDQPLVVDTDNIVETVTDEEGPKINIMGDNPAGDATQQFLELEGLIKNYVAQINNLKAELKKHQELYKDSFESDSVYQEHSEKAKEAAKLRSETKSQILKQPALATLAEKIADYKSEIKEIQDTLSDYLLQYQNQTGLSEIETGDGETMIIVQSAKLVKGSSRK
jgi:hypothetical protein